MSLGHDWMDEQVIDCACCAAAIDHASHPDELCAVCDDAGCVAGRRGCECVACGASPVEMSGQYDAGDVCARCFELRFAAAEQLRTAPLAAERKAA